MEEDVEIELLLKSNEDLLMLEASKLDNDCEQNTSNKGEDSWILNQEMSLRNKPIEEENNEENVTRIDCNSEMNYTDEVQELLDDHIVSYMVNEPTKHALNLHSISSDEEIDKSEYESDGDDQFINEIMSQSEQYEGSFMEHVKKVIGNKDSQMKYSAISELTSAHRLIIERDHLLKRFEQKFQEKLYLVEEKIQNIRDNISLLSVQNSNKIKEPSFSRSYFRKFGAPYFKDNYGFSPSPNVEHTNKLKGDQTAVMYIQKPFYWTKDHQDKLMHAIKESLVMEKSDKLIKQISKMKDMGNDDELSENLEKCQQELSCIKSKSFDELIADENENREYDWMKYSVCLFDGEHSPDECKRFWNVYLKPGVNKSSWEYAEDLRLSDIAEEHKFQDWDLIAKSLGTNRSPYQCFVHFQTRLNSMHDFSKGKWTKEEDEQLLNAINSSRRGNFIPWTKVSCHMLNRNHVQIYNRFVKCLDPKLIKGRFTKGEDLLIIAGIEVFGCNFQELCSLLSNRSYSQVRGRYERHLVHRTTRVGSWTLEEDEQLMKLVDKHGEQSWSKISKVMKSRTRTQARQRYRFIQQKMKTKPGWTWNNIKRRNVRFADKNLNRTMKIVEKMKHELHQIEQAFNLTKTEKDTFRMEKLKELRDKVLNKKYKGQYKKKAIVDHSDVNNLLNEFFKNDQIKTPESNTIKNNDTYNYYFEDLCLLAKHFGHQLQIPDNKDEILNNPRLNISLKNVLLESLNTKTPDISKIDSLTNICETNINYIPSKSDTSIINNNLWFTPPIDISRLNFSEYFKPTIFDYSWGMHKDIWKLKKKQHVQIKLGCFDKKPLHPPSTTPQLPHYNMPPNHLTTLCYKSALLSRTRLKNDCNEGLQLASEELCLDNSEIKSDFDINEGLDVFQETLITLFTWPRALSLCSISSIADKIPHFHENSAGMLSNKSNVKKSKKLRQINLKVKRQIKCKKLSIKKGNSCKRKMKIEHLLPDVKKRADVKPQVLTEASTIDSEISEQKLLQCNNENISPANKNSKPVTINDNTCSKKGSKKKPNIRGKLKSSVNTNTNDNVSTDITHISLKPTRKAYKRQQEQNIDPSATKKIVLSKET